MRQKRRESIQAALALLLGPETDYSTRAQATRRLTRHGRAIVPFLLTALDNYPEITTPAWPWWPPQYEYISRLLLYLIQHEQFQLEDFFHHPAIKPPAGPVLWTSIVETTNHLPHLNHERLLCTALETSWITVRYSAAMALATRAGQALLERTTLEALKTHMGEDEGYPVRLAASYALLSSNEQAGLEGIVSLTHPSLPHEVRKAAVFVLATDLPTQLALSQREQLTTHLLALLLDADLELAQQAAHALSRVMLPTFLPVLYTMIETANTERQVMMLTILEELAHKRHIRYLMRQHLLPTRLLPLLKTDERELRRQACYTLAVCGGEYVAAVLGTIVLDREHPGHREAIESLRQLYGALRTPMRGNIVRWLLRALVQSSEETRLTTVATLTSLLWQAQTRGYKRAWQEMSGEIMASGIVVELLQLSSGQLYQHVLELLITLDTYLATEPQLQALLRKRLMTTSESSIRSCILAVYAQTGARWAIPDLIHALLDPDEQVACTALSALARISTPDDVLVAYVISELARLHDEHSRPTNVLAYEAWMIMKKWRQAEKDEDDKKLHSVR